MKQIKEINYEQNYDVEYDAISSNVEKQLSDDIAFEQDSKLIAIIISIYNGKYKDYNEYCNAMLDLYDGINYVPCLSEELFNFIRKLR